MEQTRTLGGFAVAKAALHHRTNLDYLLPMADSLKEMKSRVEALGRVRRGGADHRRIRAGTVRL